LISQLGLHCVEQSAQRLGRGVFRCRNGMRAAPVFDGDGILKAIRHRTSWQNFGRQIEKAGTLHEFMQRGGATLIEASRVEDLRWTADAGEATGTAQLDYHPAT
jgi:hypothetical protein